MKMPTELVTARKHLFHAARAIEELRADEPGELTINECHDAVRQGITWLNEYTESVMVPVELLDEDCLCVDCQEEDGCDECPVC